MKNVSYIQCNIIPRSIVIFYLCRANINMWFIIYIKDIGGDIIHLDVDVDVDVDPN